MEPNTTGDKTQSLWERFKRWLDGSGKSDEPVRLQFPKSGDTDILLSESQRRKLHEAVSQPVERKHDGGLFSGDTQFIGRTPGGVASGSKDNLII